MFRKAILPLIVFILLIAPKAAFCNPDLTLFIAPEDGGYYNTTTETWVTAESDFTLQAIVDDEDVFRGEDTVDLYLCVALSHDLYTLDGQGDVVFNEGTTITIDGITYTEDHFTYGLPPIEEMNPDGGGGDMPPHDIFPTAYLEVVRIINVADLNSPATYEYEISDAVAGTHFDLYTLDAEGRIDKFAPFSKDAEVVPEPSTLALLGGGLLAVPLFRRLRKRRKQK